MSRNAYSMRTFHDLIVYIGHVVFLAVVRGVRSVLHFVVSPWNGMPRITEVYSSNPADCLWCHIPLLEWQQRKTFQSLSCQEGQKMKMVLHPLSVSSISNRCLPFLPTVGYVPYNTMAHGQKCCFVDKGRASFFFYLPGCSSEWIVFLLYWGPQFWVPMVIGPRVWFFLTASSVSLWWLLYVLESLCKANSHSFSAVTS